jgi:hypothetical protein
MTWPTSTIGCRPGRHLPQRPAPLSDDPGWAAYLPTMGGRPAGLVLVRALGAPARVMNSFFVVRGARRAGIGLRVARDVVSRHPGRWEIPFQDRNTGAVRFWRRVATAVAGDAWDEERRPVPGRPEVPPDVWISFDVPPGGSSAPGRSAR